MNRFSWSRWVPYKRVLLYINKGDRIPVAEEGEEQQQRQPPNNGAQDDHHPFGVHPARGARCKHEVTQYHQFISQEYIFVMCCVQN